ncbi:MAG: FHA domain-containing protein [Wujia sp.]
MNKMFNPNYYITIFDGERKPFEIHLSELNKEIITFGRQQDCDIVLTSEFVSRIHGCFFMMDNKLFVKDLESTNGLVCHGKKIDECSLKDGMYVRIIGGHNDAEKGTLMVFSIKSHKESWNTMNLSGKTSITIGRDRNNDICLDHVSVSHKHAIISRQGNDFVLTDNNSTNGVLINGKRVNKRQKLKEQDVIVITNNKLVFSSDGISYVHTKAGIGLSAKNIVKKVGKKKDLVICNDVSVDINPGELVAIVGGSGAGKSTLMNCISGYSKPTNGRVTVNGVDLYENFDALKHIIGYVPQQDIVYDNLTVYDMLKYSAKLRLPRDIDEGELEDIVNRVIDTVELTHRKNALVKSLSGGQKKRASIAVELITDPGLFFLDEPASGLDPGTERSLIRTLKGMTAAGKTVILVTHSTLNLYDYDKIVFMGTGGNICFCGSYHEALRFFGVKDVVDIYELISKNALFWKQKYIEKQRRDNKNITSGYPKKQTTPQKGFFHQFCVLCSRYIHLLINDRQRMLLLMIQAPLLAFLISIVANGKEFEQYEMTKSLLFALSCSAFWIGILSSIQEICKERNILKREYMTGLNLGSYILSKITVMGMLCLVQSVLIITTFSLLIGTPDKGIFMFPYGEFLVTTLLTAMAAAAMGIFVSSLFTNADRAMTVAPILLMPQILFSGLIFNLKDASEVISYFAVCRWSMEGYGTTADLNSLQLKMQEQGFIINHEPEDFFIHTTQHLFQSWGIMLLFVIIFSVGAGLVLRNIKRNI